MAAILSSLVWMVLAGHHSAALSLPSPQVSPFTINRSLFGDESCLFGLSTSPPLWSLSILRQAVASLGEREEGTHSVPQH